MTLANGGLRRKSVEELQNIAPAQQNFGGGLCRPNKLPVRSPITPSRGQGLLKR